MTADPDSALRWYEPRRLAAWAPDDAREQLVALAETANATPALADPARAAELFGKVFAVTGAVDLARRAYAQASTSWTALDVERARLAALLADALPLQPFPSDAAALQAEVELVGRCVAGRDPAVALRRAELELRRALPQQRLPAQLETAFQLAPEEFAILMAAVASILNDLPLRTFEAWQAVLAPSLHDATPSRARLVRPGLVTETPELVPHPSVVSRLLGRGMMRPSVGVRLMPLPPGGAPPDDLDRLSRGLLVNEGVALHVGLDGTRRKALAAHVIARAGQQPLLAEPGLGATVRALVDAAFEARLFGAILVADLDQWAAQGLTVADLVHLGRVVAIAEREPALSEVAPIYVLHTWRVGVSSPR